MFKIHCTQHSINESKLNSSFLETNDCIVKIVETVLRFFKEKNINVPPSQVYLFANILKTYLSLKKTIEHDDILYVVESVFTTIHWNNELLNQLREYMASRGGGGRNVRESKNLRKLFEEVSIIQKIRFGKTISIQNLLSHKPSKKELMEYIFLRKTGVLKRDKSGRLRAIKYKDFLKIIHRNSLKLDSVDVNDIIKYLPEIPSRYWRKLITKELIDKASLDQLLKLSEFIERSHDKELGMSILSRLSQIVAEGKHLRKRERKIVYKLMKQYDYSDNLLIMETLPVSLDYSRNILQLKDIIQLISNLPLKERGRLIAKISRNLDTYNTDLIKSLDLITLSSINMSTIANKRLKNNVLLGKVITSLAKYYIVNNESYLDYGSYYLENIDANSLDPRYKPVYESILAGNYYRALEKLSIRDKQALLEYIVSLVRSFDTLDPEVLRRALDIGYRILRDIIFRKGDVYEDKKITVGCGDRVAIRNTIYNFLRLNYRVVFLRKIRGRQVVAVLDVSGSMLPYSLWAIIALATIIHRVKYLVLFSDYVDVVKVSKKKSIVLKLLSNLCRRVFQGYTDIAYAVSLVASKLCSNRSIVIVISDLKQTKPGDPLQAFMKLVEKGCKIIVITHLNHDRSLAEKLENLGIDVIVVNSPYTLPYILKKKLNLKGGVEKESKRLKTL